MTATTKNESVLRKALWLVGAFALCFFAGGWIWWRGTYEQFLHAGFHWETFPLLAGTAVFLSWIIGIRIIPSALVVGGTFSAIMIVRVVLDCIQDPTRHNLWPFEVVVAFVFGMIMAIPPAGIGWLFRRITHRSRADDGQPQGEHRRRPWENRTAS